MVTKELSQAASELIVVLENSSEKVRNKIPKSFIEFIKKIASPAYSFQYDKAKALNEQRLLSKTRELIALIYRDFLCDSEEREQYMLQIKELVEREETEKQKKYDINKVFKNKEKVVIKQPFQENTIIDYEESFIKKFLNKIKTFFIKSK